MNFSKELFEQIKPVRIKFILTIILGLLAATSTIIIALILSKVINRVFLLNKSLAEVSTLIILFISIAILKSLLIWSEQYFASGIVSYIKTSIRKNLFAQIKKIGPLALKTENTGELTNTLINGVDRLEEYFSKFLPQTFLSVFIPILILIFVFPLDWLTGIVFIVTAPIIPIFMFLIGSIAEKMNKKQWQTLSRMSAYFLDVLQGLVTLKLFNRTNQALKNIYNISNSFRIRTLNVLKIAFLSALVLEVASTISVAVIAVEVSLRLLNGNFAFADALFILIIAPEFYLPFRMLGASYHAGMEGISSFERIDNLLNHKNELQISNSNNFKEFQFNGTDPIVIKNISYTYPDRTIKAVDDISFNIRPKTVTALVGLSGSGKTTLMNILLRFINQNEGNIFVGSYNLNAIETNEWRKNISWMPQSPHLFTKTILENINLAKENASLDEVTESAKKAKIHQFISSLPNGYNSIIGEQGAKLSGGEIQRIALARAYLRNTSLLFVDEPTANLDPIVEEEIINDMYNLFSNKTVLIIAHRLNTIENANNIIVMKDGKIVETGNHKELIEKNNYYKKLIEAHS
ncbi:MAG: thiol reductant ABC exporter subunit CydD [Ignavibacteriaceae bacterium]